MNASAANHVDAMPVRMTEFRDINMWRRVRDPLAGILLAVGLCWPFIVSSILPIRWWMFIPLAAIAGLMRQQRGPIAWRKYLPIFLFVGVMALFAAIGFTVAPLNEYGADKLLRFAALGGLALLVGIRQAPLTEGLAAGMRWAFAGTLLLCLAIVIAKRDLFIDTESYGVDMLTSTFSVTGFPLALAMAATCLIPSRLSPVPLFLSACALFGVAVVEVLVRGRYDAIVVCALAVALVLGPPWRHIFWRVMLCTVLAVLAAWVFVNVLPLLGYSYRYLTWVDPESIGGRLPLFSEALRGFWANPLGQGIGSFQKIEPFYCYPHNIVLESAFEMGILGLLAMLGIYFAVAKRVWKLWLSPPHRMLAALLILIFAHMLKAGDIAMLAFQWVMLFMLVVATPVDADWPIRRGRAAT